MSNNRTRLGLAFFLLSIPAMPAMAKDFKAYNTGKYDGNGISFHIRPHYINPNTTNPNFRYYSIQGVFNDNSFMRVYAGFVNGYWYNNYSHNQRYAMRIEGANSVTDGENTSIAMPTANESIWRMVYNGADPDGHGNSWDLIVDGINGGNRILHAYASNFASGGRVGTSFRAYQAGAFTGNQGYVPFFELRPGGTYQQASVLRHGHFRWTGNGS